MDEKISKLQQDHEKQISSLRKSQETFLTSQEDMISKILLKTLERCGITPQDENEDTVNTPTRKKRQNTNGTPMKTDDMEEDTSPTGSARAAHDHSGA